MIIYTDGSCSGNPGPGGYGIVVLNDNEELLYTYSSFEEQTTNNRQEMKAIMYAMRKYGKDNPTVYSDSAYAINTFTNWMFSWANKGWLKANNQVPENLDLVKEYYDLWQKGYRLDLRKIKGHSNAKWNNMADKLATGKLKPTMNGEIK